MTSAPPEFYVVAFENMAPVEAVGPFEERAVATKIVDIFRLIRSRVPFSIATRRPIGIPVMPAAMFVVEFEASMARARAKAKIRKEAPQ